MNIQRFKPADSALKSIIESYFYVESFQDMDAMTVPNGRVDASIVLHGELHWFFPDRQKFEMLPACTFYPLTRTMGKIRSRNPLRCFGIKLYPHVLALSIFESRKLVQPVGFDTFFNTPARDYHLIRELKKTGTTEKQIRLLDSYFKANLFSEQVSASWIQHVIHAIESGSSASLKIEEVARAMDVSIKTLERRFTNIIGLTPKIFSMLVQLQQTVNTVRKTNEVFSHGDLTEALGNGYYDQSHFIKSCQRITGLTPKKLFTRLPDPMTDLVILNG